MASIAFQLWKVECWKLSGEAKLADLVVDTTAAPLPSSGLTSPSLAIIGDDLESLAKVRWCRTAHLPRCGQDSKVSGLGVHNFWARHIPSTCTLRYIGMRQGMLRHESDL